MAEVLVEKSAVQGAIALCDRSIQEYQQASKFLSSRYIQAGSFWKDDKYEQLGVVVGDCTKALENPIEELEDCKIKLMELLKAIETYESSNI